MASVFLEGSQAQGWRQKARPSRAKGMPRAPRNSPRPKSSSSRASWRRSCPVAATIGGRSRAAC